MFVWNFKPQVRPFKFTGHKGSINEVAINALGDVIASASSDETVRLWKNTVKGQHSVINGHSAPIRSVDFSSDSKYLLTGSNDKIIKIFNLSDNNRFHSSYVGHNNWVRCARFSPDNRLIGSCADDNTVRLWDIAKRNMIHTFIDHLANVNSCRFSPDGTCIASGSDDRKIKIWDIRSGRLIQHYDAHNAPITCVSYHPSGNYLITSSMDCTIKIWDLKLGQILYTVHGHEGPIRSVSFSNCGDYFCSGGVDSILMVWKSNIKNMDEEFTTLSKVQLSKMMSNKEKINEDAKNQSEHLIKVGANVIKRSKLPAGQKCEVIVEKGITKRFNHHNNANASLNSSLRNSQSNNLNGSHNSNSNNEKGLFGQSQSSNFFNKLPRELSSTFDKMIQQLDIVVKTMKIMDQRIQTVESQVSELYSIKKTREDMGNNNDHEEAMNDLGVDDERQNNNMQGFRGGNYNGDNAFERNLVSHQGNEENEEEEMIANEEGNVPVEIFEDVGNHVEDLDNAVEQD